MWCRSEFAKVVDFLLLPLTGLTYNNWLRPYIPNPKRPDQKHPAKQQIVFANVPYGYSDNLDTYYESLVFDQGNVVPVTVYYTSPHMKPVEKGRKVERSMYIYNPQIKRLETVDLAEDDDGWVVNSSYPLHIKRSSGISKTKDDRDESEGESPKKKKYDEIKCLFLVFPSVSDTTDDATHVYALPDSSVDQEYSGDDLLIHKITGSKYKKIGLLKLLNDYFKEILGEETAILKEKDLRKLKNKGDTRSIAIVVELLILGLERVFASKDA